MKFSYLFLISGDLPKKFQSENRILPHVEKIRYLSQSNPIPMHTPYTFDGTILLLLLFNNIISIIIRIIIIIIIIIITTYCIILLLLININYF